MYSNTIKRLENEKREAETRAVTAEEQDADEQHNFTLNFYELAPPKKVVLDLKVTWEDAQRKIEESVGRSVYFSWWNLNHDELVDSASKFRFLVEQLPLRCFFNTMRVEIQEKENNRRRSLS
jgi:hypothetical protein